MTPEGARSRLAEGVVACFDRRPGSVHPSTVEFGPRFHDWLTGLPNRAAFRVRLGRILEAAAEGGPPVSVLVMQLDGFADANEKQGPEVGARVLAYAARLLLAHVPALHEVASLGGGEFAVLVTDDAVETISTSIAVNVLRALHAPLVVSDRQVFVGARIGITSTRPHHDVDTVLRNAYTALALTKRN